MYLLTVICLLIAAVAGERTSYDGFKVYTVLNPQTEQQFSFLNSLDGTDLYDFWSPVRKDGAPVQIMVAPVEQASFEKLLNGHNLDFEVQIENVESAFRNERIAQLLAPKARLGAISFKQYYRHEEINAYIEGLAAKYPDLVTLESVGQSTEGREIKAVRISSGGNGKRPLIFVDAGVHAREWIAPAMALYIINQLVENKNMRSMADDIDWVVVPLVNPDGYEFSHTHTRLWRKTRSQNSGSSCLGTDGNRNWDEHWAVAGSSNNPCSETYHGSKAFSEPETLALSKYATQYGDRMKFYLSFHSYGQYILYPWGYTSVLPTDDSTLKAVGKLADNAIREKTGTKYQVGNTVHVLYAAAGGSHDWFKGVLGVEMSFTLELPGGGFSGFDLPASKIAGVVEETFVGVQAWHKYVQETFL